MSGSKKKLLKKPTNTPLESVQFGLNNGYFVSPVYQSLENRGLNKHNPQALMERIGSLADFYNALDKDGFFVPERRFFVAEWMLGYMLGQKKFLTRAQLNPTLPCVYEILSWPVLRVFMKQAECQKFFYFNSAAEEAGGGGGGGGDEEGQQNGIAAKPTANYEYVFRVLYTVLPLFRQHISELERAEGEKSVIYLEDEVQQFCDRNFPADGKKKAYSQKELKSFVFQSKIPVPQNINEIGKILDTHFPASITSKEERDLARARLTNEFSKVSLNSALRADLECMKQTGYQGIISQVPPLLGIITNLTITDDQINQYLQGVRNGDQRSWAKNVTLSDAVQNPAKLDLLNQIGHGRYTSKHYQALNYCNARGLDVSQLNSLYEDLNDGGAGALRAGGGGGGGAQMNQQVDANTNVANANMIGAFFNKVQSVIRPPELLSQHDQQLVQQNQAFARAAGNNVGAQYAEEEEKVNNDNIDFLEGGGGGVGGGRGGGQQQGNIFSPMLQQPQIAADVNPFDFCENFEAAKQAFDAHVRNNDGEVASNVLITALASKYYAEIQDWLTVKYKIPGNQLRRVVDEAMRIGAGGGERFLIE